MSQTGIDATSYAQDQVNFNCFSQTSDMCKLLIMDNPVSKQECITVNAHIKKYYRYQNWLAWKQSRFLAMALWAKCWEIECGLTGINQKT